MPTSRQLGVLVCVGLWFGAAASSTAHPREVLIQHPAPGRQERGDTRKQTSRIKYASGAGRARAGWTLGTEGESSTMRASFKVCAWFCFLGICSYSPLAAKLSWTLNLHRCGAAHVFVSFYPVVTMYRNIEISVRQTSARVIHTCGERERERESPVHFETRNDFQFFSQASNERTQQFPAGNFGGALGLFVSLSFFLLLRHFAHPLPRVALVCGTCHSWSPVA